MLDRALLQGRDFDAQGHCRVDYTDPVTGKVLERIEGDNHVFIDQFTCSGFQGFQPMLLLSNGDVSYDADVPMIPGMPTGYGVVGSSATGTLQGSYRSVDSFNNRISRSGVTFQYVYDFLSTQIPLPINYVGLTGHQLNGVVSTPFQYRWPIGEQGGMIDIERNRRFYSFECSLSNQAGGAGTIRFRDIYSVPEAVSTQHDIFKLVGSPDYYGWHGYRACWGYDYDNQRIVFMLTRYKSTLVKEQYESGYGYHRWYKWNYRDEFWVLNADFNAVDRHFVYEWGDDEGHEITSWQYRYGKSFSINNYFRLNGDHLIGMGQTPLDYSTTYTYVMYVNDYDITTGDVSEQKIQNDAFGHLCWSGSIMYFYKKYMMPASQRQSMNGNYRYWSTGFHITPVIDTDNMSVFSYNAPQCDTSYATRQQIQTGITNRFRKIWLRKEASSDDISGTAPMPFAYTAYKLPSDAPERPENSAVTIAYGLTINW